MRTVLTAVWTYAHQPGILGGHAEELVASLYEVGMGETARVLEVEVKAVRVAHLPNGRRHDREDPGFIDLGETAKGTACNGLDRILRPGALGPVLHGGKGDAIVLALRNDAEAGNGEKALDIVRLVGAIIIGDIIHHGGGAFQRGALGELDDGEQGALVLVGKEGRRQADEKQAGNRDNRGKRDQHDPPATDDAGDSALIGIGQLVKAGIERAGRGHQEGFVLAGRGLQERRAQGWRQNHGNQDRQGHGRHDGDRELAVDHTG